MNAVIRVITECYASNPILGRDEVVGQRQLLFIKIKIKEAFCNAWKRALGRFVEHSCLVSFEIHRVLTRFLEKRAKLQLSM